MKNGRLRGKYLQIHKYDKILLSNVCEVLQQMLKIFQQVWAKQNKICLTKKGTCMVNEYKGAPSFVHEKGKSILCINETTLKIQWHTTFHLLKYSKLNVNISISKSVDNWSIHSFLGGWSQGSSSSTYHSSAKPRIQASVLLKIYVYFTILSGSVLWYNHFRKFGIFFIKQKIYLLYNATILLVGFTLKIKHI
jgi:hypothetical protein